MGSCCSSSNHNEDDEFLHRQTRSFHQPVQRQPSPQQRIRQQVHAAPSTIRIAQISTYRVPVGNTAPLSVRNSPNVLIKPKVTVESCKACGQSDHTKAVCRYRERLCFYCREEGHIISICPAKKRQRQRRHTQRRRQQNLRF